MNTISLYILTCCLALFGIMPSTAFADYTLQMANGFRGDLNKSSILYFSAGNTAPTFCQSAYATSLIVPASGTLTAVYGNIFATSTASEAPCTIYIVQNGTTLTQVTDTLVIDSTESNPFSNSSLNLSVAAGDILQMQIITPAWSSPAMSASFSVSLYIQ